MATIVNATQPSGIVAAENPIVVSLSSNFLGAPDYSRARINFNSGAIGNNYRVVFNLEYPSTYTQTFWAKDFPNQDNYFLTNTLKNEGGFTITGNTIQQIADSFADVLQKDFFISNNYYISRTANINTTGQTVTLTAKAPSARFSLSGRIAVYNEAGSTSQTKITATNLADGADEYGGSKIEGYSLYVDVYGDTKTLPYQWGETVDTNLLNRVTGLVLPFSLDNIHRFDIHEICKSYVSTPNPDITYEAALPVTTYMRPFLCKYGDSYPMIPNTNTKKHFQKGSTNVFWIMNASSDWEQANDLTEYTGSTNIKFLTTQPAIKPTSRNAVELLYFVIPKDVTTALGYDELRVHANVLFWDGSSANDVTLSPWATIIESGNTGNYGSAYIINVSFNNLALPDIEEAYEKPIKRVDLQVKADGTINYTTVASYSYPYKEASNRFGVMFLNRMGTYSSFDFYGLREDTYERETKDITYPVIPNSNGSYPEGFRSSGSYDVQIAKRIVVNTGWISEDVFVWIKELLNSTSIYSYTDKFENFLAIDGFKHSKSTNNSDYNVEITFTQTLFENGVTI